MLYLAEIYTKHPTTKEKGWDIKFVWIITHTKTGAKAVLMGFPDFDEIITIEEASHITKLDCSTRGSVFVGTIADDKFYEVQ